jgi:hypothetical protein
VDEAGLRSRPGLRDLGRLRDRDPARSRCRERERFGDRVARLADGLVLPVPQLLRPARPVQRSRADGAALRSGSVSASGSTTERSVTPTSTSGACSTRSAKTVASTIPS